MHLVKEKAIKFVMLACILLFCIATLVVILLGVQQFRIGSQLASVNQVANLSHLLVRQQANLFSMLLANNEKTEKLAENLANFAQEEFVLDAAIYANNGELLAQTSHSTSLRATLGLAENSQKDNNTQQIVEPIYSSNGLEGFLRVTFDAKYGQTTKNRIEKIFTQLYGELIIVFLVGALLASSVHYFLSHYRRIKRRDNLELPTPKILKKANSMEFHRRRRRFKS